jgi:hypothetical protein
MKGTRSASCGGSFISEEIENEGSLSHSLPNNLISLKEKLLCRNTVGANVEGVVPNMREEERERAHEREVG